MSYHIRNRTNSSSKHAGIKALARAFEFLYIITEEKITLPNGCVAAKQQLGLSLTEVRVWMKGLPREEVERENKPAPRTISKQNE